MCKRKNLDQFISDAIKVHGDKFDYSLVRYINNHSKVKIVCKQCGHVLEQNPSNHLEGQGCYNCSIKQWNESRKMTQDDFIRKALEVHGDRYDYSLVKYIGYRDPVEIRCNSCKRIFTQVPANHLMGNGCPFCRKSKGELKIVDFLDQVGVSYETEKWYDDLYYIDKTHHLRYDFYLPDYNLLIEYNGRQHYEFVEIWHNKSNSTLDDQQTRDQLKVEYAKEHNINLLIIRYNDDIEAKLREALNITDEC